MMGKQEISILKKGAFLFHLIPVLVLWFIIYSNGFQGLYGQDAYEYARYASRWLSFMMEGKHPGDYRWPMFYPVLGAVIGFLTKINPVTVLQLVSVLSLALNSYIIEKWLNERYPRSRSTIRILCLIAVIFAPYFFRAGMLVMSDMMASVLITSIYYGYTRFRVTGYISFISLTIFLSCLAVATRYASIILVLVPVISVIPFIMKRRGLLAITLGLMAGSLAFIPPLLIRYSEPFPFLTHGIWDSWSLNNLWRRSFDSLAVGQTYHLPNLLYIFSPLYHPGFLCIGFITVPYFMIVKAKINHLLIGISILAYLLFIGGIAGQNYRYFILVYPLIAYLGLAGLFELIINFNIDSIRKWMIPFLITILIVQIGLCIYAISKPIKLNRVEREISRYVCQLHGGPVYSFGMDVPIRYYCREQEAVTLFRKDGNGIKKDSYLVANERWGNPAMRSTSPGSVYNALLTSGRLDEIHRFDQNWILYYVH